MLYCKVFDVLDLSSDLFPFAKIYYSGNAHYHKRRRDQFCLRRMNAENCISCVYTNRFNEKAFDAIQNKVD